MTAPDDLARRTVVPLFKAQAAPRERRAKKREGMDAKHLANVRKLPSCIGGRGPCEAHHLIGGPAAKERGVAQKATDKWAVPLTAKQHREFHASCGSRQERAWFVRHGVSDCYALAEKLWASRNSPTRMRQLVTLAGE